MSSTENRSFHWVDWVVFAATLLVSIGIGLFYAFTGEKQKTTKEYLMGNRQLKVLPVALSMYMSFVSAIYILGTTAEMYNHGTQMWLSSIGSSIGFIFTAFIFVPLFHPLQLTSTFEYIDMRYRSRVLRTVAVIILILNQVMYMGLAMFAPATALEAVVGFPVWASIIIAGAVTTVYTTLGGMKAVVWTDVFQGFVMGGGILAVLIAGTVKVGGMTKVWNIAYRDKRINFFNFNPDPTERLTFWPMIIGRAAYSIGTLGTNQASVQRYCSLPTMRGAQLSVLANVPFMLVTATLTSLSGLVIYAFYAEQGCDPLRSGKISNPNQLLPYFVITQLNYPGLPGVFLAVLFSGALSSLSSSMSGLSAVTWKDLIEPLFKRWKTNMSEGRKALITKILVFLYGCAAIGMAFMARILSGHILAASQRIIGGISGPLSGIMIQGALLPCCNWIGASIGSIGAVIFTSVINIGSYITTPHRTRLNTTVTNCSVNATIAAIPTNPPNVFPLFKVSFLWVGVLGTFTCVVLGFLISLCTGPEKPSQQNPRYIIPLFDNLCCCLPLPQSLRKKLWCGVPHDEPTEEEEKPEDPMKLELQNGLPPPYSTVSTVPTIVNDADYFTKL